MWRTRRTRKGEKRPKQIKETRHQTASYNEQVSPIALWIAGSDALVDGRSFSDALNEAVSHMSTWSMLR
jgi:hypothetical protein